MVANLGLCNLDPIKYLRRKADSVILEGCESTGRTWPLQFSAAGRRAHDDDVVRRDEAQCRSDPLVKEVRIDVLGPQVGHLQIESRALRPSGLEVGGRGADFPIEAKPSL